MFDGERPMKGSSIDQATKLTPFIVLETWVGNKMWENQRQNSENISFWYISCALMPWTQQLSHFYRDHQWYRLLQASMRSNKNILRLNFWKSVEMNDFLWTYSEEKGKSGPSVHCKVFIVIISVLKKHPSEERPSQPVVKALPR